jgi:hypothetical protein
MEKKEESPENVTTEDQKQDFNSLSIEFYEAMEVYFRSVPFVMSGLPILMHINIERGVREYGKKHGNLLSEDDNYETYELGIEHGEKLRRRVERITAVREGVESLPNLFLIGMVSAFDTFVSQLIRAVLLRKPEILSSSEKNISFADLVNLGSIEAAREQIVEREIDILMRSSHSDQIEWLEKKLDLDLRKNDVWPKFVEICERRNLLTHTAGRVSTQYISVCGKHKYDVGKVSVGEKLVVSSKYYN